MILLIDNYDSFSYNLYQMLGEMEPEITVVRNDEITVEEVEEMQPDAIILSPGPGRPQDAGICEELVRTQEGKIPILGVCLGHQGICEAFGARIGYAKELMHGKRKRMIKRGDSPLLEGVADSFYGARYHSLIVEPETLPSELNVIAESEEGEIMAVEHREYSIYGLQFHPESIMTKDGRKILRNFLRQVEKSWR